MPTHGLLKKVYDNAGHWGLIIDVDGHGEHRLNLWDKTFAGEKSDGHDAICDVHNWEGSRVIYTAKKGKPKGSDLDDCWPSTIEMIALEEMAPTKSVREMAAEMSSEGQQPNQTSNEAEVPADVGKDDLARLTMSLINALGEWAQAIEKRTKGES